MENVKNMLVEKGFERFWNEEPRFEKVLTHLELTLYFEEDAETIDKIEAGEVVASHIIIDVENESATFALFAHVPNVQDISNADIYHEDGFDGAIEAIEKFKGVKK